MDHDEALKTITLLYRYILRREPLPKELEEWTTQMMNVGRVSDIVKLFGSSEEYRTLNAVTPFWPIGHYYSPVVEPNDNVGDYMRKQTERVGSQPFGINIRIEQMRNFLRANADFIAQAPYFDECSPPSRFSADNQVFPLADALVLRAFLNHFRPNRIIEIGSGFSTACMLDTISELGLETKITCIEPYPERLKSLLRPDDNIEIIPKPVQEVDIDIFSRLSAKDFLFLDTTHVMKTASDVHFELFEILPRLSPRVVVHFHDIPYPFEYSTKWIFDRNFSWNEAYSLRAFLMYNRAFKVLFSNSYLAIFDNAFMKTVFDPLPENPGTSLWLQSQ